MKATVEKRSRGAAHSALVCLRSLQTFRKSITSVCVR